MSSVMSSEVGDVKVKSSPLRVEIVKLRLPLLSIELSNQKLVVTFSGYFSPYV